MWCSTEGADVKGKLQDYVTYFEGTCEFCLSHLGLSQYQKDLENHLANIDEYDDDVKLLVYYDLGVLKYKLEALEEAMSYWEKAEELALKMGDRLFEAKIISYKSIYFYVEKDMEKSREYFDRASAVFEELGAYDELALHYVNILWYKRYQDDKDEVLEYMKKALDFASRSQSPRNGRVYLHVGFIYKTIFNDFQEGLDYLVRARDFCYERGNVEMECMALHVIAEGYVDLGRYRDAMAIYENIASNIRYRNITANLKCMLLANRTICCLRMGSFEQAMDAMDRMRDYIDETQVNIREEFESIHEWLMACYYIASEDEDMEDVEELLDESKKLYERHKDNFPLSNFDFHLAETFGDYDMAVEDYTAAIEEYTKMLKLAVKLGSIYEKAAHLRLSEALAAAGRETESRKEQTVLIDILSEVKESGIDAHYDHLFEDFKQFVKKQKVEVTCGLPGEASMQEFLQKRGLFGKIGVLRIDIDHFRLYNGNYGYSEGLKCLRKVADILKDCAEDDKTQVFHLGNEKFIMLSKQIEEKKLPALAESIVGKVREAKLFHNASPVSPYVTVSVGVYAADAREKLDKMTAGAEKALAMAKEHGRNRAEMLS